MIDINWTVSVDCTGGQFSVPDGTPASEISRKIDDIVQTQIRVLWSPSIAGNKDILEGTF